MKKIRSLCVYCGSNPGSDPAYRRAAEELGAYLAQNRIRLVYGGSNRGTMGILAESCLAHGGTVLGIITEQLDRLVENPALTEYRVVPDMATRKRMFLEESDALTALPGGLGTADELLEALSWQTLALNRKPVALLNISGFFDPLLAWLKRMCADRFLRREQLDQLIVETELPVLFEKLERFEYRPIDKWNC